MPKIGETKRESQGWGAVARRRAEIEKNKEEAKNKVRNFFCSEGESALVQFLQAEPYCFDSHRVMDDEGRLATVACQCMTKKRCTLCSDGVKKGWSAAFKVLDYRGNWDSETKSFKNDEKIEKIWVMGTILATKFQQLSERKGKDLNEMVFEVTSAGKGDYNIELAIDEEEGRRLKPVAWDEQLESAEDLCQPPTDDEIDEKGYVAAVYKKKTK